MSEAPVRFEKITYKDLNSRQKENYNFQKVSAVLADYGYVALRLSDDWQGADFIAYHVDGVQSLKVQLKGRLTVDTKYKDKGIWICFNHQEKGVSYLFRHDEFLRWALVNTNISDTKGWENATTWGKVKGVYTWPKLPKYIESWLSDYVLTSDLTEAK